jgi:hypothetical protein
MEIPIKSLAGLTVVNEDSQDIALHSLWQDRTAVIVFVRHFG